MLAILFSLGEETYALPAGTLHGVVPSVSLRSVPGAQPGVVGLLWFQQRHIPVLDMELLVNGRRCRERMSTRIVVADISIEGSQRLLGLRVEGVLDTVSVDEMATTKPQDIAMPGADYLGRLMDVDGQTVQLVHVAHLLTEELKALFDLVESAEGQSASGSSHASH